jgi:hypothetical protein
MNGIRFSGGDATVAHDFIVGADLGIGLEIVGEGCGGFKLGVDGVDVARASGSEEGVGEITDGGDKTGIDVVDPIAETSGIGIAGKQVLIKNCDDLLSGLAGEDVRVFLGLRESVEEIGVISLVL